MGCQSLLSGSQPIDDGNYIFKADERAAFLQEEPDAEQYLRPFVGSREFLQGGERWILALQEANPAGPQSDAESCRTHAGSKSVQSKEQAQEHPCYC